MKNLKFIMLALVHLVFLANSAQAHYDPNEGRWLSRDPIAEQGGINLYAFAGNDGCNNIDMLGQKPPIDPNVFGRYQLSYKTDSFEVGKCGDHNWVIKFLLSKVTNDGGFVIQKITYKKWNLISCATGDKYSKPVDNFGRNSFFEVFPVLKGGAESWQDSWGLKKADCTKGEIEIEGVAMFYDKMSKWIDLPNDFFVHKTLYPSSNFPSSVDRSFFPGGSDSNKVVRTLTVSWNCCSDSLDKSTKIEVR